MKKENLFFMFYFLTILFVRIGLELFQNAHLRVNGMVIHHFWIGLALIFVALLIYGRWNKIGLIGFAIGTALFFDELVFMINGGGLTPDYMMPLSWAGSMVFLVLMFIFRKKIVSVLK